MLWTSLVECRHWFQVQAASSGHATLSCTPHILLLPTEEFHFPCIYLGAAAADLYQQQDCGERCCNLPTSQLLFLFTVPNEAGISQQAREHWSADPITRCKT